ncbi:MAG: hypothetical protein QUS33_10050 [Dehalococcoidia bacterium]|nr:hypothetical protein [Dehalococcoidia bacterium]
MHGVMVLADRLIDLCARHAEQMAEQWYQALIANPRTKSYKALDKEACQRHAVHIYKNLGRMYLAENPYQAVAHSLDVTGLAEDHFGRGIPLDEVVYALVLMRRQIWLHSERQSLYVTPEDMSEVVVSINRVTLLFDYATHIVVSRYQQMSRSATGRW